MPCGGCFSEGSLILALIGEESVAVGSNLPVSKVGRFKSAFTLSEKATLDQLGDGLKMRASRGLADEETRAQPRGSRNGREASWAAGGGGDGWAALPRPSTSLRLVLLPEPGAFAGARPSRRAVSCDRVSPSSRNVSLRPHPRGFHTSSAGPRPAAVGGNTVVSERGRVGLRCLLQTPSNECREASDPPSRLWKRLPVKKMLEQNGG